MPGTSAHIESKNLHAYRGRLYTIGSSEDVKGATSPFPSFSHGLCQQAYTEQRIAVRLSKKDIMQY